MVRDTPWEQPIPRPPCPKKYLFTDNVIFRGKKYRIHVSHQNFSVISWMHKSCVETFVFRKELAGDHKPQGSTWPSQNPNLQPNSSVWQVPPWLQLAAESGSPRVYIGCDILVLFGLCQNVLCKITHPWNYPFNARISVQPSPRARAGLVPH